MLNFYGGSTSMEGVSFIQLSSMKTVVFRKRKDKEGKFGKSLEKGTIKLKKNLKQKKKNKV